MRLKGWALGFWSVVLAAAVHVHAQDAVHPPLSSTVPLAMWQSAIPDGDPMSPERVRLGRDLFFDKALSVDNTVSCASCHDPRHAFTDPGPVSHGVGGKTGARRAPTVLNAMFNVQQFWDGRADSLEAQAKGPLTNPLEMAMPSDDAVVAKVAGDARYHGRFEAAFGRPVCLDDIAEAISCFERMQVSCDAPFDRFMAGDKTALSLAARRGYALFNGKADCNSCHTMTRTSPFFTDYSFHNTGVGALSCKKFESMAADMMGREADGKLNRKAVDELALMPKSSELGRFLISMKTKHLGSFKTPSLRDVAVRGPYMHDGSIKTLRGVLEYYNRGCQPNCNLDAKLHPLKLSKQEIDDLLAFLDSLTGDRTRRLMAGTEKP
ncbi:MAG TPA: cytochrome c peroxidase [Candidatus Xenobia bacterium]|jgi:cytochrome c peroxidase